MALGCQKKPISLLDQTMKSFLWQKDHNTKGMSLISRDVVIHSKDEGDLGLPNIKVSQFALQTKRIYIYLIKVKNLWMEVVSAKYGWHSLWTNTYLIKSNWCWRLFIQASIVLRSGFTHVIGDGTSIKFFKDD